MEWLRVLCWAQVLSSQGSPGQLHLALFLVVQRTTFTVVQGGWEDNGVMLWGLLWLE